MRPISHPLRIVAVALGVVALWWVLWRAIDFDGSSGADGSSGERADRSGPIESDSTSHPGTPDLAADTRQPLASPTSPIPSDAEVVESPPEPSVRLFGSLTDERSQEPVSTASIRLVDSGWDERTAESDTEGNYAIEGMRAGRWDLAVEAGGFRTLRRRLDLTPRESERRLDLHLTPGEVVKLRIVGNGAVKRLTPSKDRILFMGFRMAEAIHPIATLEEPGRWLDSDRDTDRFPIGKFMGRGRAFGGVKGEGSGLNTWQPRWISTRDSPDPGARRLPDGTRLLELSTEYFGILELTEPLPVFVSLVFRGFALDTKPVPPGAEEVVFTLTEEVLNALPGVVRLRIVDGDTDTPPAGLKVLLDQRLAGRRGTRREADGSISFEGVLPGPVILTIAAEDREKVVERVLVEPGAVTDLGVYRLQPFSLIRAKVVDDVGKPAQVAFNVFPLDRYASTRETLDQRFFRSTVDGELKIDSVGRGRYLILASEEEWVSTPTLADTTLGKQEGLEIRVSKGTPVALRLRADPLPAARLEIRTRSGLPVAERRCRNRDPMKFVLVPGSYSIELWDGETWLASETLVVGMEPVRLYFPR